MDQVLAVSPGTKHDSIGAIVGIDCTRVPEQTGTARAALTGLLVSASPVRARVADRVAPIAAGIALVPAAGGFLGKRIVRKAVAR